jgi:hypothetical protein
MRSGRDEERELGIALPGALPKRLEKLDGLSRTVGNDQNLGHNASSR